MPGEQFYAISAGVLAGIFLHSFFQISFADIVFFLSLGALLFLIGYFRQSSRKIAVTLSIFIFALSLGLMRYSLSENKLDNLADHAGQYELFTGIISEEPEFREGKVHLQVEVEKVNDKEVSGEILIFLPSGMNFSYGDRVNFFGELRRPENFETETGRIFDYRSYLKARGINYVMQNPKISVVSSGNGNYIKRQLFKTKDSLSNSIRKNISAPESDLLLGLLFGENALSSDWQNIFRRGGLSHVVVLSGYNVTIVALFVMVIFTNVPRVPRFLLVALSIILFSIMTGASATIVRAAIMALLVIISRYSFRRYDISRALIFVALLMVLENPQILVFDISFQLSFLATLGLVYVSPIFEKRFQFLPERFSIREIVIATIATQVFVLPYLAYAMGNISLVALFANLLVLPLVPAAMLFGFIVSIFGLFSSFLAGIFSFFVYYILHFQMFVAKYLSGLSFASVTTPPFSASILALFYVIIIVLVFYWYKKRASSLI